MNVVALSRLPFGVEARPFPPPGGHPICDRHDATWYTGSRNTVCRAVVTGNLDQGSDQQKDAAQCQQYDGEPAQQR